MSFYKRLIGKKEIHLESNSLLGGSYLEKLDDSCLADLISSEYGLYLKQLIDLETEINLREASRNRCDDNWFERGSQEPVNHGGVDTPFFCMVLWVHGVGTGFFAVPAIKPMSKIALRPMLIDSSNEPELLKYVLCERMADFYGLPVDYIYAEFVDPEKATLEEVEFVLSRMWFWPCFSWQSTNQPINHDSRLSRFHRQLRDVSQFDRHYFDACYLHQRLASLLGFPLPPLIGF